MAIYLQPNCTDQVFGKWWNS